MGRASQKQRCPQRFTAISASTRLPYDTGSHRLFIEDEEDAPQPQVVRRVKRARPAPKTRVETGNSAADLQYGICELVVSAPCHVYGEEYREWQLAVELVQGPADAEACLLTVTASMDSKAAMPELQVRDRKTPARLAPPSGCVMRRRPCGDLPRVLVFLQALLAVPKRATAQSFIRLLDSKRLRLSLQPCEGVAELMEHAAESLTHAAEPQHRPKQDTLTALTAQPLPQVLFSHMLAPPQAAGTPAARSSPAVLPAAEAVGEDAVRLVLHQGADVVSLCPRQPGVAPPATLNHAPVVPGLVITDSVPWESARVLSSRTSAMLLLSTLDTTAQTDSDSDSDSEPLQTATQSDIQQDAQPVVLVPGGEDALWSLVIQLHGPLLPDAAAGADAAQAAAGAAADAASVDAATEDQGGASVSVGVSEDSEKGDMCDPAEDEDRSPMYDDLLRVLRWLLPHRFKDPDAPATPPTMPPAAQPASPPASPRAPLSPRLGGAGSPTRAGAAGGSGFSASALYNLVKPTGKEPQYTNPVPELLPVLRQYQRRGVAWMLQRERGTQPPHTPIPTTKPTTTTAQADGPVPAAAPRRSRKGEPVRVGAGPRVVTDGGDSSFAPGSRDETGVTLDQIRPHLLHPLWRRFVTLGRVSVYVNPFSGKLVYEVRLYTLAQLQTNTHTHTNTNIHAR